MDYAGTFGEDLTWASLQATGASVIVKMLMHDERDAGLNSECAKTAIGRLLMFSVSTLAKALGTREPAAMSHGPQFEAHGTLGIG